MEKTSSVESLPTGETIELMAENWVDERDKAILETIYYCENCNMVLDTSDNEVQHHKKELPGHKMRKVFIVHCGHCGSIVTDSHAEYSPERNQFWCKNCLADANNHEGFYG